MQLKHLFFALLLAFCCHTLIHAQQPYYNQHPDFLKANSVWAFGEKTGLDFNTGSPVGIQTSITGNEGFASVCDEKTGKLLFYSNGNKCWNAGHQVMPNGSGLLGNGGGQANPSGTRLTTTQGTCIVPIVDSPGKYLLFSLNDKSYNNATQLGLYGTGLYYSIVDMSLDNGNGDIDTTRKNILLDNDTLSEAMIAIPGDNCDIWILLYVANHPQFKAYHITRNGVVDTVPVVSNTVSAYQGYRYSCLTVSPDRTKIALADYSLAANVVTLGEFDAGSGIVTNIIEIPFNKARSACFSPDNSKLYVSRSGTGMVYQYDVSIYDSALIQTSEINIATVTPSGRSPVFKLYRDTIYISLLTGNVLHRINQPNLSGTACDLEQNVIPLFSGTASTAAFNSEVVFPLPMDTVFNTMDTLMCSGGDIDIRVVHADPKYSYSWNTGDTAPQLHISDQGQHTYWVNYGDGCYNYVDSFRIDIFDVFTTITINKFQLGTTGGPFASYQWLLDGVILHGATDSTYTIQANGDYQVIVTNEFGCTDTSDIYPVTNYDVSVADADTPISQIQIYPNPATGIIHINSPVAVYIHISSIEGRDVLSTEHVKVIDVSNFPQGIYLLRITDSKDRLLKVEKIVKQ